MSAGTEKITLTVNEAAKRMGCCTKTVRDLAASNQGFPAIRISPRRLIIPMDALDRWLNDAAQAPKQ